MVQPSHTNSSAPSPRRLIQTAKTADLPLFNRAAVAGVRLLNPDFEYCFFDDGQVVDFVQAEFPQYLELFRAFPLPIQRVDFFRYLAVYRLGGFYLDTDVFLARGLEPLRSETCVFPFEELTLSRFLRQTYRLDWELGNYAFGAAPGDPFLKRIIENCVRAQREPGFVEEMLVGIPGWCRGQFQVLNSTGPGLVTRTMGEAPELQDGLTVLVPGDVCDPAEWHHFGDFGVHLMQASWRSRATCWRVRLARFWEVRQRRILGRRSREQGPRRSGPWRSRFPEGTAR